VCRVAAGGEFSVIADVVGNLYTFGNPEYGQLGMIASDVFLAVLSVMWSESVVHRRTHVK